MYNDHWLFVFEISVKEWQFTLLILWKLIFIWCVLHSLINLYPQSDTTCMYIEWLSFVYDLGQKERKIVK